MFFFLYFAVIHDYLRNATIQKQDSGGLFVWFISSAKKKKIHASLQYVKKCARKEVLGVRELAFLVGVWYAMLSTFQDFFICCELLCRRGFGSKCKVSV